MTFKRLDYNANNFPSAEQYLLTRGKQIHHLGVELMNFEVWGDGKGLRATFSYEGKMYCSYYILEQYRGKGYMSRWIGEDSLPILTISDCAIDDWLKKNFNEDRYLILDCPHIMSKEYKEIERYYGDDRAKRSGVFLMNHIDEGISILVGLGASDEAIKAFCLHPILQPDDVFEKHLHKTKGWCPYVVALVVEYRNKANSYLCRPHTDDYTEDHLSLVVGSLCEEVKHMLLADKIQNQKDFTLYHKGTHPRSNELDRYFHTWINYLENI